MNTTTAVVHKHALEAVVTIRHIVKVFADIRREAEEAEEAAEHRNQSHAPSVATVASLTTNSVRFAVINKTTMKLIA